MFSLVGYSDAEWYCVLGKRINERTGLGQIIDANHGKKLCEILERRQKCENFLFAVPRCLGQLPEFDTYDIEDFLEKKGIELEAYERDMVTDDLAEAAGLYPFIREIQSRKNKVVVIGNKHLRKTSHFLGYNHFIEIESPNLHKTSNGVDNAVRDAIRRGIQGLYLVSAGVSAAVIIDKLHDEIPKSWFIDCGSIWDAFVGIGGQREWRAKLYKDPVALAAWKWRNTHRDV